MDNGQIWSIDLIIAAMIFTTGIVFFYVYALNYGQEAGAELENMQYDARHIADTLYTPGFPTNWSAGDAIALGISDQGQLNESKLAALNALATADYSRTRALFATTYFWYVNLSEPLLINNVTHSAIGLVPQNPKNMFRVQRITAYKNKPVVMNIYVWE